ncbi:choice-of-anchor D domain-containing protein [Archangium sp.]|uniref:choice-of-anchor D domain-containing protein n=1 Tax=Archangium sp. TaxID=1872627 RepID=UPI002ED80C80
MKYNPTGVSATTDRGTLTLTSDDPDYKSIVFDLTGKGVKPNLVLNPNPLSFGDQRVGAPITKTVTVHNNGNGPIDIKTITSGGNAAFSLVSTHSLPYTLAPAGTLEMSVKYLPAIESTETDRGTLTLTTEDLEWTSVTINLTGKGVKPELVLDPPVPTALAFGDVRINTTVTKTVTVSNTGTGPINITHIYKSAPTSFTLGSLPSLPHTLAAKAELKVLVTYNPTAVSTETDSGTLNLLSDDPAWRSVAVNLTGKGVAPNVVFNPNPLAFGDVRVTSTVTQTVTVSNTGTGPITITNISRSGHAAFALVNPPSTPFTLAKDQSQPVSVRYNPTTVSTETDTGVLLLATGDPELTRITVNITGKGVRPNIVLDPNPLAFGEVRVGTDSVKTVTVRNNGNGSVVISNITQSGSTAFTLVTPSGTSLTPFPLAAGASKVLSVKFSPSTETPEQGVLTLATEDQDWPSVTINLNGRGVRPGLVLEPSTVLAFGEVRVGTDSVKTVTVRNNGTGPIVIKDIATGTGSPFQLVTPSGTSLTPFPLAAGANKVLSVKFSPSADASASDTLTFTTEDSELTSVGLPLSGKGVKPSIVFEPNPLAFGDVRVGTDSVKTVTVRNTGTGPIVISGITQSGSMAFQLVTPSGTSLTPFPLAAGANKVLSVKFSPSTEASAAGRLILTTEDTELTSVELPLSGRGVKPSILLEPNPLAFGEVRVNTDSTKTVTVRNTGTGPIVISDIIQSGSTAFSLVTPADTSLAPFPLAAGASKELSVKFSPTALRTEEGVFTLATQDPDVPSVTITLTGKGVRPSLVLDPPSTLPFGEVRVGTNSLKTVKLSNKGTGPLVITGLSTGTSSLFTLVSPPGTPFTLAAGAEEVLTVKYSPTTESTPTGTGSMTEDTGTLTVTTRDSDWPSVAVSLSGRGVKPHLVLEPSPLAFGSQIVGETSTPRAVKVRNTGTGPVRISGMSISTGTPFSIFSTTTAFNLLAGASEDIQVKFSPTSKGNFSATLTLFTDDTTRSTVTVALSGAGVSELKVEPAALIDFGDVAKGQTATRTVTLTNNSTASIGNLSVSALTGAFGATQPLLRTLNSRGSTTTFTVSFTPDEEKPFSTALTLQSDADNGPHEFSIKGAGVVPEAKLSLPVEEAAPIASLNFEGVRVNATTQLTVRLTNTGRAALSFSEKPRLSSSTDSGTSVFSYLGPDNMTLAPGTYIDFQIAFQPAAKITYSDTLIIKSNAKNSPTVLSLTGFGADPELKLDRTSIFFGDVRVGSRSAGVPVTINNTGNAPVSLQNLPVAGAFEVALPKESDGGTVMLPRPISVRGSFTFNVVYKPATEATENGTVSIVTDMTETDAGTLKVALSGNGTTSRLATNVNSLDFGGQRVRQTSGVLPVILTNPGKAELEISQFVFSNSMFDISSPLTRPTEEAPLKIGAGQQKTISVTFTPSTLGSTSGQFFIISNAANANDAGTLGLAGKGIDGQLTMTPGVISFDGDGGVEVGGSGAQQSVMLTNTGEAALTIFGLEPPDGGAFTVSGLPVGQTDAGVILQPVKGEWPLTVTFTPSNRGFVSTSAIVRSDSVTNPAFNMLLKGTGVAAAVDLLPKDLYFGKSNVGVPTTQDISIKNVGERDLYVSNISFADVDAGVSDAGLTGGALDFGIGSGSDGGMTFPMVVSPGKSTLVPLKFTPREVGPRRARAIVYTNDKVVEASLLGEGSSPNLAVSSADLVAGVLDFKSVVAGKTSTARVLKLTNTGNGSLILSRMTLGGADATSFILTPLTLPITLQPGAFTEVLVSLKPDAERQFSAQLVIESNDAETPSMTVPMVGVGVRQQIELSKTSLEFGQQLISHTSNSRSVFVTNSSDTNVNLTGLGVEGSGASQFTVIEPLATQLVLPPGQKQEVKLTFTPQTDIDVNCVLKIYFTDLSRPLEVALHGKGIPAVLSIAPSPLDFGGVRIGSGKRLGALTITNKSSDTITLAAPEVLDGRSTGEPFSYDGADLEGDELAPGMSAIITVGYEPKEESLSETTLSFGTTKPLKPRAVDVQLKGSATKRLLFVDHDSLDFGFVKVDKPAEPKLITITNRSAQQQRVVVKLRDAEGAPFTLGTKELTSGIAPGGTASFSVTFDPDTAGVVENEAQVWLQGATEAEVQIPLKGQGTALVGSGGGCACNTTEAGSAGMLMLLALVGLGSRRRRHG